MAVVTDGRWAPTRRASVSCVSRSGTITPVGRHPPPPLGQVPEQHQQAHVDATQVGDGQRDRQRVRAVAGAAQHGRHRRWPLPQRPGEGGSSTARRAGSSTVHDTPKGTGASSPSRSLGRSRSPWPTSSVASGFSRMTSRLRRPSRTSRPRWPGDVAGHLRHPAAGLGDDQIGDELAPGELLLLGIEVLDDLRERLHHSHASGHSSHGFPPSFSMSALRRSPYFDTEPDPVGIRLPTHGSLTSDGVEVKQRPRRDTGASRPSEAVSGRAASVQQRLRQAAAAQSQPPPEPRTGRLGGLALVPSLCSGARARPNPPTPASTMHGCPSLDGRSLPHARAYPFRPISAQPEPRQVRIRTARYA